MKEYVYTGSEQSLDGLLIWWGTLEPFEHSDDCTEQEQMHCCSGRFPDSVMSYSVIASCPPWPVPREFFPIAFVDYAVGFEVVITEPHKFIYDGEGIKVDKVGPF